MAKIETYFDCDLKKAVQVQVLNGNVFSLDNNGSRIGVKFYDNGQKTTVTGSVSGRFILANGQTIDAITGTLATVNVQSVAYLDVPQSVLHVPGPLKITIQLTDSSVVTTVAAILATVYQTKTDDEIVPSQQVIDDWNAAITQAIGTQNAAIAAQNTQISDLKSAFWEFGDLDFLWLENGSRHNATDNTVTFTWNTDKTECTVNGTNTGNATAAQYIAGATTRFPQGVEAGKTYRVKAKRSAENVYLGFYLYKNGVYTSMQGFSSDGYLTIPSDATGMLAFIACAKGVTVSNAKVYDFGLFVKETIDVGQIISNGLVLINGVEPEITSSNGVYTIVVNGYPRAFWNKGKQVSVTEVSSTFTIDNNGSLVYYPGTSTFAVISNSNVDSGDFIICCTVMNGVIFGQWSEFYKADKDEVGAVEDEVGAVEDAFVRYGALDLLHTGYNERVNEEKSNITFGWNDEKTVCTVNGENTTGETVVHSICGKTVSMIKNVIPGKTYNVKVKRSDDKAYLGFYFYVNNVFSSFSGFSQDGTLTIPATATGMVAFIGVPKNANAQNTRIYDIGLYSQEACLKGDIIQETLNIIDADGVPSYYESHLTTKESAIREKALLVGRYGGRFAFVTDYHVENNTRNSASLVKRIMKDTGIRTMIFGGDAIQSQTTKAAGYEKLCAFTEDYSKVLSVGRIYNVIGNHEENNPSANPEYTDRMIDKGTVYQLLTDGNENIKPLWSKDVNSGYYFDVDSYYIDDDKAHIRYYFVCCDYASVLITKEIRRIAQSLGDVPEEYAVIFCSHVGIRWDSDNNQPAIDTQLEKLLSCAAAMNDGTSVTVQYTSEFSETYNYANKARTFIGVISGHCHYDAVAVYDSRFPVISTTTDAYSLPVNPSDGSRPQRAAGTYEEQAFDVVQFDVPTKRIYLTRIGGGSDRVVAFGENAGIIT